MYPQVRLILNDSHGIIHDYVELDNIKFGSKITIDEHVSTNGFPVQWSESVRYLGSFVDSI